MSDDPVKAFGYDPFKDWKKPEAKTEFDPFAHEAFAEAKPEGSFVGNVVRGAKDTYSLMTEALPGMARAAAGDDEGAKKNLEQYKKDLEAHEAENPRTFKGDITDIHGVGDAWEFAKQAAAEMLPSILPSLVTGGVGGIIGKKAAEKGAEALARGVTERLMAEGIAKSEAIAKGEAAAIAAINKSIAVGAAAGSFPGSFAQNAPETFAGIFEETGQLRPGTAAFVGALKAGLDTIEPVLAIRRAMGPAASEALVDRIMAKVGLGGTGIASRVGRGAVEGAVTEGLTESAQEAMDVAAENIIKGSPELFDQRGLIRIATAGAAGAVGGGAFGGGAGFMSKAPSDEKSPDATDIAKSVEEEDRGSFKETGTAVYDPREGLGDKLVSKFKNPDKAISPAFWMKQTEAEDLDAAKAQMASYARNGYLIEKDGKYYPNPAKPLEAEAPHEFTQRLIDRLGVTENVAVPEKVDFNPYDPQTEPEKFKAYQDFEDSKKHNERAQAQLDAEEKAAKVKEQNITRALPNIENMLSEQYTADEAKREEEKAKAAEIQQREEFVQQAQESQTPQGPTSTEATVGAAQELFEGADVKEVTKATRNFFETATPGEKFTVGDIQGRQRQEGGISTPQHARELISDAINNDRVHVDEQQNLVVGPSPFSKTKQAALNKEWGVIKPKKPKKGGVVRANQAASIYQSILKNAVDNLKQEKGSGEQMLAMIQKSPGVKQEEIAWMDLDTFLKNKKSVTKKEIQDYMAQNAIDLKDSDETTMGKAAEVTEDDVAARAAEILIYQMINHGHLSYSPEILLVANPSSMKIGSVLLDSIKFAKILENIYDEDDSLQMQSISKNKQEIEFRMKGYDEEGIYKHLVDLVIDHESEIFTKEHLADVRAELEDEATRDADLPYSDMVLEGPATDYSILKLEFTPKQGKFFGGHWGQNTFGHIRADVRKLVDGIKVLFGNEFQSDWASQQRKIEGVNFSKRGAEEEIKRLQKQLVDLDGDDIAKKSAELLNILDEIDRNLREISKIAKIPFEETEYSVTLIPEKLKEHFPETIPFIEIYDKLKEKQKSIYSDPSYSVNRIKSVEKIKDKIASLFKHLDFQNASIPDLKERVKKAYVKNVAAQQDFTNFVNDFAKNVKSLADKMGTLRELKDEFKSLDFYYHAGETDPAAVERSKKRVASILDNHKIRDVSPQDIDKAFELNNKRIKTADEYKKLSSMLEEYKDVVDNKMAEAPWMHTWLPLLFRKFVKHAVETGQDGVAWPSQASQVEQIEGWDSGAAHSYAGIVKNYTERLPQYAKEWGKKFGVRPELKELENGEKVWFMPINDQMRASVRDGVPLFAKNLSDYQATIKAPSAQAIADNQNLDFAKGGFSALLRGTPIEKYARELSSLMGIDVPITFLSKRELAYPGKNEILNKLKDSAFSDNSSFRGMQLIYKTPEGKLHTFIIIDDQLSQNEIPSVLAHEIGHVMEEYYFHNAPENIKNDVIASFRASRKIKTGMDVKSNFYSPLSMIHNSFSSNKPLTADEVKYYNDFKEWFAEQTAKWSQSDKRPVTLLEKFFHKAYEIVKQFFMSAIGKHYLPTDAFQRFMDYSLSNRIEPTVKLSPIINYALAANKELTKINPAKGADATIKFMSGWSKLTDSASNVAAKHKEATGYVNATNAMYEHANEIIAEEAPLVESYINLPKAQQERVAKVLLIGNIARQEYSPVNGNIVAVATDSIANTDVKKGDTITLAGPEVKAYLDFRKLFSDLKKKTLEVYSDNEKVPPSMNLQGYIPLIRQGEGLIVGTKQGSETAYVEAIKKKPFESHAHFVQRMKARAEEVNNEHPGMYITHGEFNKNNFNSWELEKRLGYLNAIEMLEGAAGDKEISDFLEEKKKEYMGKSFKRHSIQRKEIHVQGYIAKGMSPADYISSAVGDYLAKSAHRIARQKYAGQIAKEVKVIEAANNPNLTQWAHNHHNYINSPQEEFGYVRAMAFHGLLGFNISSAVMNFFQPFQSTLPVLAANSNPVRASAAVLKGIGQVFRLGIVAIPKNKAQFHSFGFNEKALSKLPPELADILRNAYKKGHLTSTTQAEVAIRNEAVGGRFGKVWTNLLQASSYAFGAVELANRMATHIAAYELYKSDPKFIKNMEVLQKNSRFRDRQMSPAVAAEMINEMTQFNTSKANRPEMMRGAMTIPTQFMNYSIYSLELWGNALRGLGGPEGKAVAGQTLAYLALMLFFMAGTMGMPFADNLDKFLRYLTKTAGMREFNLEYEVEKFWRSMGLSETSVRAMTHGKLGELLGVHIGPRLGLGNIIGGLSPNAVGGPALSMTMDKIDRAAADLRANRVGDAIVHGLLPQAMSNLHEAMVAGERGFQDRRLNVQMSPQQIAEKNAERVFPIQVAKGMGFTPQPLQNMRNIQQNYRYLEERNKPLKQSYMNQLGDALLQSHFARQAGDMEKSERLKQEFQQILLKARREDMETLKSGHPEDILKIDPQAVFRHVRENMMGALSPELVKRLPPYLRPAAMEARKRNND